MNLLDVVREVRRHLEENGRVSLRMLQRQFELDDDALEEGVEELVEIQRVAARDGKGLTWIGPTPSPTRRDAIAPIEAARRLYAEMGATAQVERLAEEIGC